MTTDIDVTIYIDETGDRGSAPGSSPVFGMAALVLDRESAAAVRLAVATLRNDFEVPANKLMSWKEHAKNHDRRRRAAEVLGAVPDVRVCYVYSVKSALSAGTYRDDQQRFYNYVAYKTYKSALWAARYWKGSNVRTWTRFGHVRGHDHKSTERYIRHEAANDPKVPHRAEQGLKWVSADKYVESQAADIYAGFLKSATWPDGKFNYIEPAYILTVWNQLRNSEHCAIPLGLMSMPSNDLLTRSPWFPCSQCPRHASQ